MSNFKETPGELVLPSRPRQLSIRFDDETLDFLDRESLMLSSRPPFSRVSLADVVRAAIREYRANHAPTEAPKPRARCNRVVTTGGEYCTACFARSLPGEPLVCKDGEAALE